LDHPNCRWCNIYLELCHGSLYEIVNFQYIKLAFGCFHKICLYYCNVQMVISDQWSSYKDDDVRMTQFVKDNWWENVDYILSFFNHIYDVLRRTNIEASCLHLVYEMYGSMMEDVRKAIYKLERISNIEESLFHQVVHATLIDCWTKSSTPLHCLPHSLNPRLLSFKLMLFNLYLLLIT